MDKKAKAEARRRQKFDLMMRYGSRVCPGGTPNCTKRVTDLHEIVNRQRTVGSEEARDLSMVNELVVLLCRECNMTADTDEVRVKLLNHNARLYGQARVAAALRQLETVTNLQLVFKEWLRNDQS